MPTTLTKFVKKAEESNSRRRNLNSAFASQRPSLRAFLRLERIFVMSQTPEPFPEADPSSFIDPGVSNGDVDWLFRGREVKKLTKRSNTISNEVQSQLLHAQQKMLAQQKEKELEDSVSNSSNAQSSNTSSLPMAIPISQETRSFSNDVPLKSSLKSNLPKISTNFSSSPESANSMQSPPNSSTELLSSSVKSNISASSVNDKSNGNGIKSPVADPGKSRSRSSSAVSNPFSKIRAEPKPAKKSIFSSLSAKIKGTSSKSPSNPLNDVSSKRIPSAATNASPIEPNVAAGNSMANVVPLSRNSSDSKLNTMPKQLQLTKNKLDSLTFKRVNFALDGLIEDPQQQIPSRRPKRGNVLIPDDLLAPPPKLSIGITNSFNEQTKDEKPKVDPRLLEAAVNRQKFFTQESKRHLEEAHLAAMRMAKEVSSFSKRRKSFSSAFSSEDEDDEDNSGLMTPLDENLDIDTPIHNHVNYFGTDESEANQQNEKEKCLEDITLEILYTRCCHLREILPIPATLKQLKNKTKPLHVLKMLNPRPTFIDVLSFSDFLAIAPIISIIFDNVTIDNEMLKILLISLTSSIMLNKLSLRNVPIDQDGWKYICKFLTLNKSLQRLDVSQQKVKKIGEAKSVLRSDLDWDLFIDSLVLRGGIEELVIHGCALSTTQFNNLVKKALSLQTKRLGLASSNLDLAKMTSLAKWISSKGNTCVGVDFGFNDLSNGQILPFIDVLKNKSENINLQFFSLNSTNIKLEECIEILKQLKKLPKLRFLDLGNNSHLFPDIIPVLREELPQYPDLRRLHFEFDGLTQVGIVQLCLIFPKCLNLVHVSLLGNQNISMKTAAAVYGAIKSSNIYNLDVEYDQFEDDEIITKIAFYLMRNMERCLTNSKDGAELEKSLSGSHSVKTSDSGSKPGTSSKLEDLIFDGALLTKTAENLLGSTDITIKDEERALIYKSIIDKTIHLRADIHNVMNKLFALREMGKLTTEGKENLLRFCLLDDSLENTLHIFTESIEKIEKNGNLDLDNSTIPLRPAVIRRLSAQLIRHQSSDDVIDSGPILGSGYHQYADDVTFHGSEDPHQVVVDADRPVDSTTGKPVLMRKFSQTHTSSKKLEEEEGELHRWGFFVQQQNDIMPDDSQQSYQESVKHSQEVAEEQERIRIQKEEEIKRKNVEQKILKIGTIPSGPELRETIMKAKGIESINDLINKVNKDFSTVENIYKHVDANARRSSVDHQHNQSNVSSMTNTTTTNSSRSTILPSAPVDGGELSPTVSLNSLENYAPTNTLEADEMYDRILDHVVRVRSNK